jgi:hypothetical protein
MDRFKIVPLIKTVGKVISSLLGANRAHDLAVFHKLDGILDESRMQRIMNYSFFTECLHCEERELLCKFVDALQASDHQYQNPVIELRARKLGGQMSELLRTVESTFWSDDRETLRFRSDPVNPTAYDRELDQLHDAIDKAWKAYKAYRQVVKDRLKV